ncbi:MAG: sulfite exporter TauE/SafE family protein [Bacilli bacterium]
MIYIIIFIAAIIAAITGIGGGIIIRPILSTTDMSAIVVNFYACIAIISSTLYSIIKAYYRKESVNLKVIGFLSIGSFVGGVLGNIIFQEVLKLFSDNTFIVIQSILLIVTLSFVLYASIKPIKVHKDFSSRLIMILVGIGVGMLSVFVGIGGGVINVIILDILFKMDKKSIVINSLVMIFISQTASALLMIKTDIFSSIESTTLLYIILTSFLGGIIGKEISLKITSNVIKKMFIIVITVVLFLNLFIIIEKIL